MSDAGPWKGRTKEEQRAALEKVKQSVSVENGENAGRIAPPGQANQVARA